MPLLNLAGTPAVRYPDPLIKRTNPNGTQEFTSYQAFYCYYDADSSAYQFVFGNANNGEVAYFPTLLFGSDYASIVNAFSQYEFYVYDSNGDPILTTAPSFVESLFPGIGGISSEFTPPFFNQIFSTPQDTLYKQITSSAGKTYTNNVEVQGFQYTVLCIDHNLWHSSEGSAGARAAFSLQLNVTLNGATTHSTSTFLDFNRQTIRIPVILHEKDLTQAIKDNGYVIENVPLSDTVFGGALGTLDVVGIFTTPTYTPAPPIPEPTPDTPPFPYNAYQARFALVTVPAPNAPSVEILNFPVPSSAEGWPNYLLMFNTGAPVIVNAWLQLSGASPAFIEDYFTPGQYVQVPISTRPTMGSVLLGTDSGTLINEPITFGYQERVIGTTRTLGTPVSGYFVSNIPAQRELVYFYNSDTESYDIATAPLVIEVVGKSSVVSGPSNWTESLQSGSGTPFGYVPIVVNEDTFGSYTLDSNYTFSVANITYIVVGIWTAAAPQEGGKLVGSPSPEATPLSVETPAPSPLDMLKQKFSKPSKKP